VEEIYVLRSVRTSRIAPTDYCTQSRTSFAEFSFEDEFILYAVATAAQDGAVVSTTGNKVASLHACFGKTLDPKVINFYGEGKIADISFKGNGKCTTLRTDFPEAGIRVLTCFLDLGELRDPYVGGMLTTNSVLALNTTGETSNPPGYVQPSIATVRLWKHRPSGTQAERIDPSADGLTKAKWTLLSK
jgi:hypothetical protein